MTEAKNRNAKKNPQIGDIFNHTDRERRITGFTFDGEKIIYDLYQGGKLLQEGRETFREGFVKWARNPSVKVAD